MAMIGNFGRSYLTRIPLKLINNPIQLQMSTYLDGALKNSLAEIYSPPKLQKYDDYIRKIKSINRSLRKEGVLAPGDKAYENVQTLYRAMGSKLDSIPVVHVGGTNGKACFFHSYSILSFFKFRLTKLFIFYVRAVHRTR